MRDEQLEIQSQRRWVRVSCCTSRCTNNSSLVWCHFFLQVIFYDGNITWNKSDVVESEKIMSWSIRMQINLMGHVITLLLYKKTET